MPDDRSVEISLNINPEGAVKGLDDAVKKFEDTKRRIEELAGDMGSFDPTIPATPFLPPPPPGSPSSASGGGVSNAPAPQTDPGIPIGGGRLGDLQDRFAAIQAIAPNAPDIANMGLGRLQTSALNASLKDPDSAREYQELINSIKELRGTVSEDGKKRKDDGGNLLQWLQANALMSFGQQTVGNIQQGNLFSAAGGMLGGAMGMLGGPAGMAVGASVGSGLGGMIEQLMGGAGGAREFEKSITDTNQRFGLGNLNQLKNYSLGEQNGYTGTESAGMIDQLRENRALSNPAMAGPLVNVIQEMTRALGLNAEATIEMAGIYSRSGGEKGAEGVRGYLADVVGGAVRAGFESNVEQYANLMGSARMQSVQTTGQGVSDRAFDMLQDVMGGLTGGSSRTSGLFRDNAQMAGAGLQSFMSYGGTADPYSTSAAYMRLAGIDEANLDSRFISPEQMAQNAQRSLGFTTNRLQQMSGMGSSEFQAAAAADPNFVQGLIGGNAGLQRQTASVVSGFIGREANAQDLRAYEQLTNIAAANGGQLPMGGGSPDSARVDALIKQLQASPADEMREKEAARHNRTMEAMSNFMNLQTKIDEQMTGIAEWFLNMDLKAVEKIILDAMGGLEKAAKWMIDRLPEIRVRAIEAFESMKKVAGDLGDFISTVRNSRAGKMLFGDRENSGENPGENLGGAMLSLNPIARITRDTFNDPPEGLRAAMLALNPIARIFADDEFNDTPGSVTAAPGHNTFAFAPGDVVTARQGGISGGATLTDVNLTLVQNSIVAAQWHREDLELGGVLLAVTDKIFETDTKMQADLENYVGKQFPLLLGFQSSLVKAAAVRDSLLAKIEQHCPIMIAAIEGVQSAIASLGISLGGAGGAGGGGGAFASGLFTGPSANIGGSSANHIDTKIATSMSWEEIDGYFMQLAEAYAKEDRRIEFSNSAVSGEIFDPNMPQAERIDLLQRAAAAHRPRDGFHSFDYYIPQGDDARSESSSSSSAGAEMYLPNIPGARLDYSSGGDYGNYVDIYDANGNLIMRQGHGDDRRSLPQDRAMPTAPAAGGGQPGAYSPNVNQEFLNATDAMAQRLGIRPEYLLAAMGFETGGTFNPAEPNKAGSGAVGLIQFMPDTARGLGTSTSALAGMSQTQQLQYVERHLRQYSGNGQLDSLEDVYMSILYPAAIGKGPNHSLFTQGSTAYRQNQGLDVNRDGRVTVGEATERVRSYLPDRETLERLPSYQGRASAGGNTSNNIAVNVSLPAGANAGVMREAALVGTRAALDEFEERRLLDTNPRNRKKLTPIYG